MSVQVYRSGIVSASGDVINDNLIKNSRDTASAGMTGSDYSARTTRTYDPSTGIGRIEVVSADGAWNAWRFITNFFTDTTVNLTTGTNTYTYSIDVRVLNYSTGNLICGLDFRTNNSVSVRALHTFTAAELDGRWHRVSATMTTANSQNTASLISCGSNGSVHAVGTVIEYKHPKLEVGSIATPWTMATTDTGYVGNNHGFMEIVQTPTHFYEDRIDTVDFIEY